MTDKELKLAIQKSVIDFSGKPLCQAAVNLFKTLGYNTDRQNPFAQKTFDDFRESFLGSDSNFNEKKAFVKDWQFVDLLFQLTEQEISSQQSLFDTKQVDNTIIETYLFFSIELADKEYNRTQLAQITREINKVFPMPVLIVFKHSETITLSVINRRLNKKDYQKDVLEKVTVIKDISIVSPHRAHIEIFFDLSFSELQRVHKFTNFVELHNAWQKTLDTKELNKRFYRDLSNWYFWALQEVHFPTTNWAADKNNSLVKEEEKVKEHNAKNLIRLLTRLLFVWFVKEKNLIPDELFDESYIKNKLLNGFEPRKKKGFDHKTQGSSSKYYRAILQNLFFATLNQTRGKREFRKDGQQMNVTNLMRYESYFKDPNAFIKLVEDVVPFMNGGLFECLDSPDSVLKGKKGGDVIIYEDGFSDRKDNALCVPDYIFFGTDEHADLSDELGDKKQKDVTVSGLINILKSYKFTVTENTPIEEDIALDPELLGRVFENLLASYNPETKTTARKQTGSFYTPREIVNYMVDESLKAYLKQKLETEAQMLPEDAETGLEFLVGYNEKEHLFDEKQTAALINAIDNCKILDPACGSGAFPMGILHKLVHILHKLDADNKLWKEVQRQKAIKETEEAFKIGNKQERENRLKEISDVFEYNSDDYGRKLFLIENCIYGVDIQPIATQISKLRFFISLIVDQKADKARDNFGIRPLPNLETKFVAANTLIGIEKPKKQLDLFNSIKVQALEEKLKDVRHRLFSAKTPATKRKLRDEDQKIREEMGILLTDAGWANETAKQLAGWDPYNQNASIPFFDMEWMFGITDGFDVVIGNPPYVRIQELKKADARSADFLKTTYASAKGNYDLYVVFVEKGLQLLNGGGHFAYILPHKFFNVQYGKGLREIISRGKHLRHVVHFGEQQVFEGASNYVCLLFLSKASATACRWVRVDDLPSWLQTFRASETTLPAERFTVVEWNFSSSIADALLEKLKRSGPRLLDLPADMSRGHSTGDDEVFIVDATSNNIEREILRVPVFATDFSRYRFSENAHWRVIFPYRETDGTIALISETELRRDFPRAFRYLESHRKQLDRRKGARCWYGFTAPRNLELHEKAQILVPLLAETGSFAAIPANLQGTLCPMASGGFTLSASASQHSIPYLLGLLNSQLLFWMLLRTSNLFRGGWITCTKQYFGELPITAAPPEKQKAVEQLVNRILAVKARDTAADVSAWERKIDQLVYALYGLTPEEIQIVECAYAKTIAPNGASK